MASLAQSEGLEALGGLTRLNQRDVRELISRRVLLTE